jgi:cytochrome c5
MAQESEKVVDAAALRAASLSGAEWLSYGRDYAETRFSPLDQIDDDNVDRLGFAWYYDTRSVRVLEGTPIVSNGVLFGSTSWSNVFALDARTGDELWYWHAEADRERGSKACCDVANRGVALYDGKVFVGVIDGRLAAIDAKSGETVWDVQTTPVDQPYTITGAPRIVEGKVIIGNGGAEYGTRGFVSAYDADTGGLVWRFYTVPGDPAKPFESPALEAAADTWSGEWWTMGGGGTVWDGLAYDPEAGLLYVGTGNGSPWVQRIRSPGGGDNLYLASILALDDVQYVSVLVGWGGAGGLRLRGPPGPYKAEGRLYTFVLDGEHEVPQVTGIDRPPLTVIEFEATDEEIAHGADLYGQRCSMCHGVDAESAGTIADLRHAAPAVFDGFDNIVRGGAFVGLGMPRFQWFGDEDIDALRAYILSRRSEAIAASTTASD